MGVILVSLLLTLNLFHAFSSVSIVDSEQVYWVTATSLLELFYLFQLLSLEKVLVRVKIQDFCQLPFFPELGICAFRY